MKGKKAGGKSYKVHPDGYDQTRLLKGEAPGARKEFFYITDEATLPSSSTTNGRCRS